MLNQSFRKLYEVLLEYSGSDVFTEILEPWLSETHEEIEWLRQFSRSCIDRVPEASSDDLCNLYTLSRVNDIFLLNFQKGQGWSGVNITLDEYSEFMRALGMVEYKKTTFHPFFHEVVEVSDQPELSEYWPTLMLGNMLFSRAGVHCSRSEQLIKDIADTSSIYWTFRRRYRPCNDLSQGWGNNSQWTTEFRRDYYIDNKLFYNVDAKYDVSDPHGKDRDQLSYDQRVEIVKNRCFIISSIEDSDLWPYDFSYEENYT